VQRNIGQFGGDPRKVTLFGQSSGGTSVDALITSTPHDPPFRAGIMESGEKSINQPVTNSTASWIALAKAVGCPTGTGTLKCMQGINATELQSVEEYLQLSFNPIVDGLTLVAEPAKARMQHQIANVPVMIGTNAQEGVRQVPSTVVAIAMLFSPRWLTCEMF
jgi:carboxylesterase type B